MAVLYRVENEVTDYGRFAAVNEVRRWVCSFGYQCGLEGIFCVPRRRRPREVNGSNSRLPNGAAANT
jgi:hypothetical protein